MASTSTRRDLRGEQAPSTPNGRSDSALGITGPQGPHQLPAGPGRSPRTDVRKRRATLAAKPHQQVQKKHGEFAVHVGNRF